MRGRPAEMVMVLKSLAPMAIRTKGPKVLWVAIGCVAVLVVHVKKRKAVVFQTTPLTGVFVAGNYLGTGKSGTSNLMGTSTPAGFS